MNRAPRLTGTARAGLYLFAAMLIFWPLTDLLLNVWPVQPGNVQWRYGFAGLLASFLHTPMLGLLLALAVAWSSGHRGFLRALALLQLVAALGLVLVMGMFALDLLQVRAMRPPDSLPAVMVGGVTAGAKHLTAALVLTLLGIGTFRGSARMAAPESAAPRAGGVVVKKPPTEAAGETA